MGHIFTTVIYSVYVLLTICALFFYVKKSIKNFAFCFIALLQINVTSFFNVGFAWTGDYIVICFVIVMEVFEYAMVGKYQLKYPLGWHNKKWVYFFCFCGIGVIASLYNLNYIFDSWGYASINRSLKSFLRYIIVFIGFIVISKKFLTAKIPFVTFIKILSITSIFPVIVVFYQTLVTSSPMLLYHNNKTFNKVPSIQLYDGIRSCGLSNESSFFAYLLLFSFAATLWLYLIKKNVKFLVITLLQFCAVAISMSRIGLIGMFCISMFLFGRLSQKRVFLFVIILVPIALLVNEIMIRLGLPFNLFDRALSIGNTQGDMSVIERYGIFVALIKMAMDPHAILGFGFFNYMYHIANYLPDFLTKAITYNVEEGIPSFNLAFQLIAENGIIASIIFAILILKKRRIKFDFEMSHFEAKQRIVLHQTILLIVVVFSFSFNILTFPMTFIPILYSMLLNKNFEKDNLP